MAPQDRRLFDLRHDPLECCNLAGRAKYGSIERELDQRLLAWMAAAEDPLLDRQVNAPPEAVASEPDSLSATDEWSLRTAAYPKCGVTPGDARRSALLAQ